MYGKAFESMYTGSMVGAGLNVFAVWNYAITKAKCGIVELNPKLMVAILGGTIKEVESAMAFLTKPDPESRSKEEEGRRLVREGQFQYRVVNWAAYQGIKNADDLREYNRIKQADYRARKKALKSSTNKGPSPGEVAYGKALDRGDQASADNLTDPGYLREQPAPYG